jgi:hypothetical protein
LLPASTLAYDERRVVSVIIPTYNDAHFLQAALDSCLAQTIPVEIVLVDDGSTTPRPEAVSRFIAEHRDVVTCVKHAWNCGLSAARNTGIAHARFDLVVPLDADDWFLPGALAPLVAVLTDEVDVAYGNVFDSGKLYEPVKHPLQRADFLDDTPLFCSSLFRKTMWRAIGGYTVREGPHYEDWNFWAKAFKAGFRFRYAPVTVYEHRSRPDSMLRHLHHERAKYVRVATAPLIEPDPVPTSAVVSPPAALPAPSAATPSVSREPQGPAGSPTPDSLRRDLVVAHARIGRLLIALERLRATRHDGPGSRKSPELISAHATIGRLLLEHGHTTHARH